MERIKRDRSGQNQKSSDEIKALKEKNRQLKEALKAKEKQVRELKRWREYFQGAKWGIAISSKDGKTIDAVNPAFARMLGYSPDELLGRSFQSLFVPQARDRIKYRIQSSQKGKAQFFESENVRKNGTTFPVMVEVNPVKDEQGEVQYHTFSILDITERKRKERSAEKEAEHYRNIWNRIHEEIMVIDPQYRIVDINDTFIATFGLDREEIVGHHCYEISHGYNAPCNEMGEDCPLKKVFAEGKPASCLHKHSLPNGLETIQDLMLSPVKDKEGNVQFVIEAVREVTELHKLQESILAQESFLNTILNNTHDAIVVLNDQFTVLYANRKLEELLGQELSLIEGKDVRNFLDEKSRKLIEERFRKRKQGKKVPNQFEMYILRGDGSKRCIQVRVSSFLNQEKKRWTVAQIIDITETRKLEKKLKQEESLIRSLLDNIPDIIYLKDTGCRYTLINKAHAKFVGLKKAEDVIGKTDFEFFEDSFARQSFEMEQHILKTGEPLINKQEKVATRSGQVKWLSTTKVPLKDEEGEIIGLVGISRDVTDRVIMFQALKEAEERFRKLFESAPDGYFIMDMEGEIVDVNRTVEILLGYKRDELIGKYFLYPEILPEEETSRALQIFERTRKGKSVGPIEFQLIRKDGSLIYVEIRAIPAQVGEENFILGIGRDVSARKQRELQIRKLATVIEQASEYVLITNLERKIEYVNPAFERMTGYSQEEVLGKSPKFLLGNKYPEEFFNKQWETVSAGEVWSGSVTKIRKDGSEFYTETTIFPIRNEKGEITHFASVCRDITREKKLEEQFQQAQKMEAIGRLAGGVAHDFNNILTVIGGFCDMMLSKIEADAPFYNEILQIRKASDRAANLTSQLLAFSRRQMIQPRVVNLNIILRDLEKMLHRLIGEDILLELILEENLGNIRIDPGQVEQIVMNLVVNARDAMPTGGKLTIETANVSLDEVYVKNHIAVKTGRYVMLAISDTGMGMDEETRKRIFEPFFTTKAEGGTGLGLATVYGIVKQNDGNIWVYSEPGQGTTFKIYFPRVDEPSIHEQETKPALESLTGSETVLLVEDDEAVRTLTKDILAENGYTVLEVSRGEEAIGVARERKKMGQPIHLLLTDVVMPEMSGKDLAKEIQEIYPEIKILYMSGYTDNAITHHGVLANEIEFIQKPFTAMALLEKLREILSNR